jgi:hypothetical protein
VVSNVDRILETIDHGQGQPSGGIVTPTNLASCARIRCVRRPQDGHDFCTPCLAWLRFESDDDPIPPPKTPEESVAPEDDYYEWVAGMCGY